MCGIAELHDTKISDEKFAMPACMVTSVPVRATPGEFVVAVITTVLSVVSRTPLLSSIWRPETQ